MVDVARAQRALHELRALGVSISIDDFGTGHSSLERLKALPVDELKIDKSFVLGMQEDPRDLAIVETAVMLARRLALRVVAEGVESAATWRHLRALGCHEAQGYLISPPLDGDQLAAFAAVWTGPPVFSRAAA
jgi:EAL domain-containing protein (putative c-di-GMP-specific phosphodiesterase class I)